MEKEQAQIYEFHKQIGLTVDASFVEMYDRLALVRLDLIIEELAELSQAVRNGDNVKIADALGDLVYVVKGFAVSFGIDLDPIFQEIHRSNMTKIGGRIENGKLKKPLGYSPANLAPILTRQKRLKYCYESYCKNSLETVLKLQKGAQND